MKQNPFLTGRRLYLRPLEHDDLKRIQPWLNHPVLVPLLGSTFPASIRTVQEWFARFEPMLDNIMFGIVLNEKNRLIGFAYLDHIRWPHRVAEELAIIIGEEDARGNGYGTEALLLLLRYAFRTLGLKRIECQVVEFNTAAIRCFERIGFKLEGTRRKTRLIDGNYYNVLAYGLLDEDIEG